MGQNGNKVDSNLITGNIKNGVSIFGVAGNFAGSGGVSDGVAWTVPDFYAVYKCLYFVISAVQNSVDIKFSEDGLKMFVLQNKNIYIFSLSEAFKITTVTYSGFASNTISTSTKTGMAFSPDGKKFIDTTSQTVEVWNLTNAYDLVTGVTYNSYKLVIPTIPGAALRSVAFNSTGTKMYLLCGQNKKVYQWSLPVAWNVENATYDNKSFALTSYVAYGMFFNSDGTKMFVLDQTTKVILTYNLSTAWDISTAVYSPLQIAKLTDIPQTPLHSLAFSNDGKNCYVLASTNAFVYQWRL